jgi:hypothetical protein
MYYHLIKKIGTTGLLPSPVGGNNLQRKCSCNGNKISQECETCQKKTSGLLQRKPINGAEKNKAPGIVQEVLNSGGKELDKETQLSMGSHFGHDFSKVRVHTDTKAVQSANAVNALAYTVRNNLVFNEGQYNPQSHYGQQLLAHELTHVVQQSNAAIPGTDLRIGKPNDVHEQEADTLASAAVDNSRPASHSVSPVSSAMVQGSFLSGLLDVVLFIPRLFGSETFLAEDLKEYLKGLKERKGPDKGLFADNKARACVTREQELGPYDTQTKTWLIEDMLDGYTSAADENSIIALLKRSKQEAPQIISAIGRDRLWSNFSGKNRRIIEAMTLTSADAGEALISKLRKLSPGEIQDYASNATDKDVQESVRRAAALAKITAPAPAAAVISTAGEAAITINGVNVTFKPDGIDPSIGTHAYTYSKFNWDIFDPIEINSENADLPVPFTGPLKIGLTIWTDYPSEESKSKPSGYGVGTRPGDENTLRFHERGHGDAWIRFLTNNPPPVFSGTNGMLPAQFNAALQQYKAQLESYKERALKFALVEGDCVGTLPTDEQLAGTGFTAAICH